MVIYIYNLESRRICEFEIWKSRVFYVGGGYGDDCVGGVGGVVREDSSNFVTVKF